MQQPYGQDPTMYPPPPVEEPRELFLGLFDLGPEPGLWYVAFVALGLAILVLVLIAIARSLLRISSPNEALVFSGSKDGNSSNNYTVLRQGKRQLQIPILHKVDRLDMRLLPVDIVVQNAYSEGNIPLQIHAIATVKVHNDEEHIGNAIERFLGRGMAEIQTVAQQTLEGAVREVIATLTPEQVNEDRLKFAKKLEDAAIPDLDKLGLLLDTLKIQTVSDDTGYLDSIGRPQIAAALRDAENAENQANRMITQAQAGASQRADVSKATAETKILEKRNELRQVQAELEGDALAVEREAEAAAKTARAEAEKKLQEIRATLEEKRLQADVVIPAEVQREAQAILSVGDAAPTAERGAAAVRVLEMMGDAWRAMGPQAKEIYVIQHLEEIVSTVVSQLDDVEVREVNVLDQGDGTGMASYAATYPQMVASVLAALAESTGVNVPEILNGAQVNGAQPQGGAR